MGCWSIAGYLPSFCWYPIIPGWREARWIKCLAQGHRRKNHDDSAKYRTRDLHIRDRHSSCHYTIAPSKILMYQIDVSGSVFCCHKPKDVCPWLWRSDDHSDRPLQEPWTGKYHYNVASPSGLKTLPTTVSKPKVWSGFMLSRFVSACNQEINVTAWDDLRSC